MQKESEIRAIEISLTKHMTENEEKVLRAALSVLPPEVRNKVTWKKNVVQGHYGNQIILYKATFEGEEASKIAWFIFESLDKTSLRYLISTLESRLDPQGNLYIRLHKQFLLEEKIVAWDGDDVVKLIIKTGKKRLEIESMLKKILGDH